MITPQPTSPSPGDGWWWSPIEARWKPRDAIDKIKRLRADTGCSLADAKHAIEAADYNYDKALAAVRVA